MKFKTIGQRIHDSLFKQFGIDDTDEVQDQDDHLRIGWYSAGYRQGFRAGQRKRSQSTSKGVE